MKKTLTTVWLLAALRYSSGCIGPVPVDESAFCDITPTTKILISSNILNVRTNIDASGQPYQTTNFLFGSTEYQPEQTGITLVLDGISQISTVWNGRLIGLGRPTSITEERAEYHLCVNAANFWEVQVGFGTIAEEPRGSRDPGFSRVGHLLRENQEIQVRLDVCRDSHCIVGIPRTLRVHLVP